ncbi:hypothetical protein [Changchengzhania lutea]|uniref:hypothetical protein n=1 Tax=Changchengzhania lutea TaxID=2049305 RepID=UPI00115E91CB|nr:hypothetical protein [Changchengzhania lutea]
MKKTLYTGILLSALLFSCSSSSNDDLTDAPDPNPNPGAKITYNANIKSIMSGNCTSCHGSTPTNGAPMSLTTYSQVTNAVQNRGLIARINSVSNPMPQNGLMPQNTRDTVQQWVDDGLLEN